ncbi:MAG: hypothetical protein LGB05_06965 [Sulfurovum sp.]|nr:hypothetical protein [Sulfurovum sp.]MCB4773345.1 hypothetical protein [Sulfurovum sp.]MCB4778740.1 hypothetical protein [Sulfurovum sp.]MCB4780957.1 hypothetical protein [Sulfurovum sp.]MCB4781679.1 hypothetical protein [Sulfurovum sp.]
MSVRKNFNFDDKVSEHLEEMAKEEGKTQTEIIQEAIEKIYRERERSKKLAALNEMKGFATGLIGDIDIKQARIDYLLEKYGY